MQLETKRLIAAAMALAGGFAVMPSVEAQYVPPQGPAAQSQGQRPPGQTLPAQPQPKQQNKRAPSPADSGSDAPLGRRVEQLEEQLVDMQVVIGTLESLGRSGGPAATSTAYRAGSAVSGPDAGRIAALETQVQALSAQIEQMNDQLRAMRGGAQRQAEPAPGRGGFSTTTVTGRDDPMAGLIGEPAQRPGAAPATGRLAAAPQAASSAGARQQYEAAYNQLLQQNYPAAESGFAEFMQRFPTDELAPNAQFWLGETYFVRSQWDSAAAAFLKVAQNYGRSDKAPDSLAKFAMSMERKGNKQAACRALSELNTRYPNPPAHVKSWETAERRRAGCA